MQRHHICGAVTAAITIAVVACGPTSSTPSTSGTAHFPVTITGTKGASVTIDKQPRRIVSLSATATEMLFAINAGAQVVAVDDQSNYPASAPMTKLSGFQPNIEAIASYTPDLVVAVDDTAGLVHGLGALNIPVLIETAAKNFDDAYKQIQQLGAATGRVALAVWRRRAHSDAPNANLARVMKKNGSTTRSTSSTTIRTTMPPTYPPPPKNPCAASAESPDGLEITTARGAHVATSAGIGVRRRPVRRPWRGAGASRL